MSIVGDDNTSRRCDSREDSEYTDLAMYQVGSGDDEFNSLAQQQQRLQSLNTSETSSTSASTSDDENDETESCNSNTNVTSEEAVCAIKSYSAFDRYVPPRKKSRNSKSMGGMSPRIAHIFASAMNDGSVKSINKAGNNSQETLIANHQRCKPNCQSRDSSRAALNNSSDSETPSRAVVSKSETSKSSKPMKQPSPSISQTAQPALTSTSQEETGVSRHKDTQTHDSGIDLSQVSYDVTGTCGIEPWNEQDSISIGTGCFSDLDPVYKYGLGVMLPSTQFASLASKRRDRVKEEDKRSRRQYDCEEDCNDDDEFGIIHITDDSTNTQQTRTSAKLTRSTELMQPQQQIPDVFTRLTTNARKKTLLERLPIQDTHEHVTRSLPSVATSIFGAHTKIVDLDRSKPDTFNGFIIEPSRSQVDKRRVSESMNELRSEVAKNRVVVVKDFSNATRNVPERGSGDKDKTSDVTSFAFPLFQQPTLSNVNSSSQTTPSTRTSEFRSPSSPTKPKSEQVKLPIVPSTRIREQRHEQRRRNRVAELVLNSGNGIPLSLSQSLTCLNIKVSRLAK